MVMQLKLRGMLKQERCCSVQHKAEGEVSEAQVNRME